MDADRARAEPTSPPDLNGAFFVPFVGVPEILLGVRVLSTMERSSDRGGSRRLRVRLDTSGRRRLSEWGRLEGVGQWSHPSSMCRFNILISVFFFSVPASNRSRFQAFSSGLLLVAGVTRTDERRRFRCVVKDTLTGEKVESAVWGKFIVTGEFFF